MIYSIQRDGHAYPTIDAESIGGARYTIEEILEHEIEAHDGDGFRWVAVRPNVWRYQVVDADGNALMSADLTPVGVV